ncbi:MAG: N-substituted formamide deformylase [Ignavibacteria bacterium]|nr:N-substituted formamide deformylase [Ignavibacteria bacterium]
MKTLFINAKVWNGESNFSESIGFDSITGKITFTGSNYEANLVKKDYDEIYDMNKKLVIPSFSDGHCHFIEGSLINSQLDLRNAFTKNDFINGILEYKSHNGNNWIYGGFFSDVNFKEEIFPGRNFLDKICPEVPMIISRFDMHSAFANSKALELSGLESRKSDFTSDEILEINGRLTGELKERAMDFVLDSMPQPSLKDKTEIAFRQMKKLHSYGITSISDITLKADLEVYKELLIGNKFFLKIDARLPFAEFPSIKKYKDEFREISSDIKFRSFKAFYDGSLSSRTAYMNSNYKGSHQNGIKTEYVNSGNFEKDVFEIDNAGYQMSVHAIGDKAVSELLDLNDALNRINGKKDRRFRIEHAQHIAKKDFKRFKELNVIASVQPGHLFSDAKTSFDMLEDYATAHNYKRVFDYGARICFGTDFPVISENPFETICTAVTRKTRGFENGFMPELGFTVGECIESYTSANAYAVYEENERGKLQTGYFADIAVINQDLFEINPDEIKFADVHSTYFKGNKIY